MRLFGGFAVSAARERLGAYIAGQWPKLKRARHLEILVRELEAVERGRVRRLAVAMPPGHGKSLTGSQGFLAWYLGRHPDRHAILACHTEPLATDFGRRVLSLLTSDLHRRVFPDCEVTEDAAAQSRFAFTKGGAGYCVGLGTAITGRRAHLLVIDDPFPDRAAALSAANRKAVKEWYQSVAYPRLFPDAAVVLIQTRWHEDDLMGWLLQEHAGDGWRRVIMPAVAEEAEGSRKPGEALWPEMFPLEVLKKIREYVGSAVWESLYQQRPAAAEGAIFKREWWRFYKEPPQEFDRIIFSADTAFQAKETSDYSAVTVWGETKIGFYLLFATRGRWEFPELKKRLVSLAHEWRPHVVLIENRASGQSLIQELRRETNLPIRAWDVSKDKTTRAAAVTPTIEAGRCFLPEPSIAPWVNDFLDELSAFPTVAHDDWVDSTTMALDFLRGRRVWTLETMEKWIEGLREIDAGIVTPEPPSPAVEPEPLPPGAERRGAGLVVMPTEASPKHLPDTMEELITRLNRE